MFKKISGFRKMLAEYIANALSEKSTVVMAIDQSADSEIAFDCKYIDVYWLLCNCFIVLASMKIARAQRIVTTHGT